MRTHLECLPCFVRQTLEAARLAGANDVIQERVMRQVCQMLSEMNMTLSPPAMAQLIHRVIHTETGVKDIYADHKKALNETALELIPELREQIQRSADPWLTALRLAMAGNSLDLGVYAHIDHDAAKKNMLAALNWPIRGNVDVLREKITNARHILYLADNTGEIVIDRLFIEQLLPRKITVVVRGKPILNDATPADARMAGLCEIADVIDNGSDAPGTILTDVTPQVRELFSSADVVLAKGQGNYETLSTSGNPRLFFLLMAKCPLIVSQLGCCARDLVVAQCDMPR